MDTMDDTPCKLCETPNSAYVYHCGDYMAGGYGSAEYDMRRLVWLKDAPAILEDDSAVCDQCVTKMVEDGMLEEIKKSGLSEEAYKNIFLMGVRHMYSAYLLERKPPEQTRELDDEGVSAIERLRGSIHTDHSSQLQGALELDADFGDSAYNTGKSHALAAVMLGYAGGDSPDFSDAAETYAQRIIEYVNFIERLLGDIVDD